MRLIKDKEEIGAIQKACELGDKAFNYILTKVKKEVSEKEISFELEYFMKKNDAKPSFPSIVAFGKNSSVPHHQTGETKLKLGDVVLLDFGVKLNNYCSDMTRTVFFGKPTDEQKKMYQTVLIAQQKAISYLESRFLIHESGSKSIKAAKVDQAARKHIITQGYPTIPHSLGHGIGLEVHEAPSLSPNSKSELKPGMVFSIEPGIYIPARNASASVAGGPGFGGIRIEDLVVLEKSGPRLLTTSQRILTQL